MEKMDCPRLVRNGFVGVVLSEGYDFNWSAFDQGKRGWKVFEPRLIEAIEKGERQHVEQVIIELAKEYGEDCVYINAAPFLKVKWVSQNDQFIIHNNDGHEMVYLKKNYKWLKA